MNRAQIEQAIRDVVKHQDATFALYKKYKHDSPLDMVFGRQNDELTRLRIALEEQLENVVQ